MTALLTATIGFVVSLGGAISLLPLLRRHALDTPIARSSHSTPTPRGGGVAVAVAITVAVFFANVASSSDTTMVLAAMAVLTVLGFFDDLMGLSQCLRFAVQVAVSAAVCSVLIVGSGYDWIVAVATIALGVGWLTAFTNAYNFMDGIDGISALTAIVAACWYLWIAQQFDVQALGGLSAALLGAAAGFLPLNYPRARLFLGDSGSYGLGFLLGCMATLSLIGGVSLLQSLAPLLVYVADTGWTLLRRVYSREQWWKAHREHVYQRLNEVWANSRLVPVVVCAVSATVCLATLSAAPRGIEIALVIVILSLYLATPNMKNWRRT